MKIEVTKNEASKIYFDRLWRKYALYYVMYGLIIIITIFIYGVFVIPLLSCNVFWISITFLVATVILGSIALWIRKNKKHRNEAKLLLETDLK